MSSSSEHPTVTTSLETKSLLPQHTRPRNVHSPRKSITRLQPQPLFISFTDPQPQQPLNHHQHRRCRILISTLFISTTLVALLTLIAKFIIFPYILPTPTPTLSILSISFSRSPNSSSTTLSARISLSNPTYASTFHFSDSAYTLHYNSKPISETNPSLRIQIPPRGTLEIEYEMVLEKSEERKRGVEDMIFRAKRGDTVRVDMTVYLYGSSAITPWSLRMVALFYDCIGIVVHSSAADGRGGASCQLVEKLTS